MYAVLAVCLLTLAGCTKSEPVAEKIPEKSVSSEPLKSYPLTGEVARLDPDTKIATIKHQAIGDWMGAMTMDFPVKDPADFAKLSTGKPVSATVFVQGINYWVGEVKDSQAK
ncbi:MAG: copper-binding protein [Bryobacteraceae bacterium]